MDILFLSAANSVHTVHWVNGLRERGYRVVLVSLEEHSAGADMIAKGVKQIYLPIGGIKGYYLNALFLRRIFETNHFDVVHVHYASGYGTLARIARLPDVFLSVWGSDVYDFPYESKVKKQILIKNLEYASVIGSTSYAMAGQVKKFLKHKKRIKVVPFGVDLNHFTPQIKRDKNEIVFGIVKTLSPKYGIDTVLKSFAVFYSRLPDEGKKRVRLEIYGKGELLDVLKVQAKKWKVEDKVVFGGYIPNKELPKVLNQMDVFVLGSKMESFGVAAVEAMACALPVIATDAVGFQEVIRDGETGYIVPVGDVQAMAGYMMKLYRNKELRRKMGENGRRRVEKLYDWEQCMDSMIRIYKRLVNKKSRHS